MGGDRRGRAAARAAGAERRRGERPGAVRRGAAAAVPDADADPLPYTDADAGGPRRRHTPRRAAGGRLRRPPQPRRRVRRHAVRPGAGRRRAGAPHGRRAGVRPRRPSRRSRRRTSRGASPSACGRRPTRATTWTSSRARPSPARARPARCACSRSPRSGCSRAARRCGWRSRSGRRRRSSSSSAPARSPPGRPAPRTSTCACGARRVPAHRHGQAVQGPLRRRRARGSRCTPTRRKIDPLADRERRRLRARRGVPRASAARRPAGRSAVEF